MRPVHATVHEATTWLEGRVDSPRREAEILLAHALGLSGRTDLYTHDITPTPAALAAFHDLVTRRAAGTPIQYLLGHADFYESRFRVRPGVFIPRPETELLVTVGLSGWGEDRHREGRLLEIGVGSGAVSLSLLRALPRARALGVDVSTTALRVATENAIELGLADRFLLVRGDGVESLSGESRFDLLVSNPPYVATDERLPSEVHDHEPREALYSGVSGLDVIEHILAEGPSHLVPGGLLALEIGEGQGEAVRSRVAAVAGLTEVQLLPDLAGKDRVVTARAIG